MNLSRSSRHSIPFLIAVLVGGCSVGGTIVESQKPTSGTTSRESSPTASPSPSIDDDPGVDIDYLASWTFPDSIDGWNIDIYDDGGMFRAIGPNECYLFASQAWEDRYDIDDELNHSQARMDEVAAMLEESGLEDIRRTPSSRSFVYTTEHHFRFDGYAEEIEYVGVDGTAYKGWYFSRTFDDSMGPISYMANYTCPAENYSPAERDDIFDNIVTIEGTED